MIDNPFVEPVACDPNSRCCKWLAATPTTRFGDPYDGKVGRAAAKVGDQKRGAPIEPRSKAECCTERLVHIMNLATPLLEHQVVALSGQRRIGSRPGIFDRTADDDARRQLLQLIAGMGFELLQEQPPEILEPKGPPEYLRSLKQWTGGDRLERLDEAAVERRLQIFRDRPGAGFAGNPVPPTLFFPETQC